MKGKGQKGGVGQGMRKGSGGKGGKGPVPGRGEPARPAGGPASLPPSHPVKSPTANRRGR
jgi:hypothetical protein